MPDRRPRLLLATLLTVAVVGAACTDDPATPSTGVTTAAPTTTTTVEPTGDPITLEYGYEAGDVLVYDVELSQDIVLETSGTATAVAEEDLPASADVTVTGSGVFTYTFAEGPDEGTLQVTLEGTFETLDAEGTVDGEPVGDASDLAGFGVGAPVSRTMVVDRRGRTIDDTTTDDPLALGASPLAGLSGDLGRVVGPTLPSDPVRVGEAWTEESEQPIFGEETMETRSRAVVTGREEVGGRDTLVVEATTETGSAVLDLSEFFSGFLGSFQEEGEGTGDVVFRIDTEPSASEAITVLDPEAGEVLRSTVSGPAALTMQVALPDEETGSLEEFTVSLRTTQTTSYSLR